MNQPLTKEVRMGEFRFRLYSISWLARLVNRSANTVRRWEARDCLPRPIIDVPGKKARWYSAAELRGYAKIIHQANIRRRVPIEDTDFKLKAQEFRAKLMADMQLDKRILGHCFEAEANIKQAFKKARLDKWKQAVDRIL
jgi:DNA-binding transcriptional MerR regulator